MRSPSSAAVVCTYNGLRFVAEQLESIRRQTRNLDAVYVFDDASTDGTYEYLTDRYGRAEGFRIVRRPSNLGYIQNFEQAVANVTEDIIFLCDQDDRWHDDKVETIMALFERDPELQVAFGDLELMDHLGANLGRTLWDSLGFRQVNPMDDADRLTGTIARRNVMTGASMALRTSFAKQVFPSNGGIPHDHRIALCAIGGGRKIISLERPLADYRLHGGQLIGDGSNPPKGSAVLEDQLARVRRARDAFAGLRAAFPGAPRQFLIGLDEAVADREAELAHCETRLAIRTAQHGRVGLFLGEWLRGGYHFPREWRPFLSDGWKAFQSRKPH